MPDFGGELGRRMTNAQMLAVIGERAKADAAPRSFTRAHLTPARLESLYEMAYLRMFVSWEAYLEQVFLRYLCGYSSRYGTAPLNSGISYFSTLANAENALYGNSAFLLWHNPSTVADRSRQFFRLGTIENVVSSSTARLNALAAIRHRIAHDQDDARRKFDSATMMFTGKRYRGSQPGSFLRDWDTSVAPSIRWLDSLGRELAGLALQIA